MHHTCSLKFHVECARRSNYYLEVAKTEGPLNSGGAGGGVQNRDEKRLFCESHRPLKLIRDIEERKKFMNDEIVVYSNVVKKCTDIIERNRTQLRSMRSIHNSNLNDKKWKKQDKKILLSKVKEVFLEYPKLKITLTKINENQMKASQKKRERKEEKKK